MKYAPGFVEMFVSNHRPARLAPGEILRLRVGDTVWTFLVVSVDPLVVLDDEGRLIECGNR